MQPHFFRLVPFGISGPGSDNIAAPLAIEISGTVTLEAGTLNVIYNLSGATERVKSAAAGARPSRQHDLWRSTCFELFVKTPTATEYWEYNLAPNRDWNVYHFTGYRSALQQEPQITAINITPALAHTRLASLHAALPLPPSLLARTLAVGISSVIEDAHGHLHYFALQHGGKADFHDPANFVLSLDPASA